MWCDWLVEEKEQPHSATGTKGGTYGTKHSALTRHDRNKDSNYGTGGVQSNMCCTQDNRDKDSCTSTSTDSEGQYSQQQTDQAYCKQNQDGCQRKSVNENDK